MTDYLHDLNDTVYWTTDAEQACNRLAQDQSRTLGVLAIREDIRYHNERMQAKVLKQSIGLGGLKYEKSERADYSPLVMAEWQNLRYVVRRQRGSFWSRFGTRKRDR